MHESVRALAFSDSHGDTGGIKKVLASYGGAAYIFHLGDYAGDARFLRENTSATVLAVRGNCDRQSDEPYFDQIILFGHKIILTHGDQLGAKYSTDRLLYHAQEQEAAAILFGHTHMPLAEYENGVWLINPGSISRPAAGLRTAAQLMIGPFGVVPKIIKIA